MAQNQEGKQKVRLAGIGTNIYEKGFGYYRSNRYPVPMLSAESKCIPMVGWRVYVKWSLVVHNLMGGKYPVFTQMQNSF